MNYRFIIFILTMIFAIFFSIPSFTQSEEGKKISLGLDLQGGLYMLLGVETEKALENKIKTTMGSIKYYTEKENILIDNIEIEKEYISFVLLDSDEKLKLETQLSTYEGLKVEKTDDITYKMTLTPEDKVTTKKWAVNQAIETIRNRLDQFGLAEPSVTKQGEDNIVVELPGIKTPEEEQRARNLIAKPANLELMAVNEKLQDQVYNITEDRLKDSGSIILSDSTNIYDKYVLKQIPILTGDMVSDAKVGFDEQKRPMINFTLNSLGGNIFADFTGKNIGKRLAIVLDGKVFSAPVVNGRIGGGSAQITGNFTIEEAGNVAIALKSGSLPAPITMLEKRSVGPSLGADSIKSSMIALISGYVLVLLFMVIYYRNGGIITNVALIVNLLLIISIMAMFGATLTLPGMAGIVLTVGMAVDANVIIMERIRELLKSGEKIHNAIHRGYDNAMSAIFDANITTLFVAIILYAYGTGPIKGFAITISIGILASMLTAIVCTYGIYEYFLRKQKIKNNKTWFGV